MNMSEHHETFEYQQKIKTASDRSFGLTMGCVLLILGFIFKSHHLFFVGGLILAAIFITISLTKPQILGRLNHLWIQFGELLAKITQPIILGLLYYFVLTPFAILFRAKVRKDMPLDFEARKESYWIEKKDYAAPETTLKNQF